MREASMPRRGDRPMANYIRSLSAAQRAPKPPHGQVYRYWRIDCPGLHLKVTPTGQRTWVFTYRVHGSKKKKKQQLPGDLRVLSKDMGKAGKKHWKKVRKTAQKWRS